MKERDQQEPTLFEEINEYLRKEAPERIENPTVEGIAARMGIPKSVLETWLKEDARFREELIRLKDFQTNDPFKDGTEFDYFIHSSGIQFVLDETKKRYTV
jgi:hypothetical protein